MEFYLLSANYKETAKFESFHEPGIATFLIISLIQFILGLIILIHIETGWKYKIRIFRNNKVHSEYSANHKINQVKNQI